MKVKIEKNQYGHEVVYCPFCKKYSYLRPATKVSPDRLRDLKRHIKNQAKNEALEFVCDKQKEIPHLDYFRSHTKARVVLSNSRWFDEDLILES